jgi:hypothetical protein
MTVAAAQVAVLAVAREAVAMAEVSEVGQEVRMEEPMER